jgi:hypothetical protein
MCPIQLAFLRLILWRMFLSSLSCLIIFNINSTMINDKIHRHKFTLLLLSVHVSCAQIFAIFHIQKQSYETEE